MYKKTGLYAVLLGSAWLGPIVLFHGLKAFSQYCTHSQAYSGSLAATESLPITYQVQLPSFYTVALPVVTADSFDKPKSTFILAQAEQCSDTVLEQPLGMTSYRIDTQDAVMYDDSQSEESEIESLLMNEQLQKVAQQLEQIEVQLGEKSRANDQGSNAEVLFTVPEQVIIPEKLFDIEEQIQEEHTQEEKKLEKQNIKKIRKAALKKEKEQKRLQKQSKKQSYKIKRHKVQEQHQQKLLIKQISKEHKQKALKTARNNTNYQDSNLIKKQLQQKIELLQLQVNDLYKTVFNLKHSATLAELLSLLRLLIIQKKEYGLIYAQSMGLMAMEFIGQPNDLLQDLELRIKTVLEKIRDRLYLLFGALVDSRLAEQFFINQHQQELSDQMQELQELLELQLTTIGKEGIQEYSVDLVQQELFGLQQEHALLKRTMATQIPLLEQLRKQEFVEQMELVLKQKERAIDVVKNMYKDMVSVSKLKQI